MSKFRLINIQYPGRVHLPKKGEINLIDLPEDEKEKLYKDGFPYFELTPEGRAAMFPDEKPVTTKKIMVQKDPEAPQPKKTTKKKTAKK